MASEPNPARKKRNRYPKHKRIVRAYRFAMDIAPSKQAKFFAACDTALSVRNKLVALQTEERRTNRQLKKDGLAQDVVWRSNTAMDKLVSDWAKADPKLARVHSHILQDVVDRVEEGTKRWFEALASGRTSVSPPRPKDPKAYRSFTFKQYGNGCRINKHRVFLSGFGWFKIHDHRKMMGQPKTITVKFMQGRWWCIVTCAVFEAEWYEQDEASKKMPDTGCDPGLTWLLATSDGRVFDPPRTLKDSLVKLRRVNKAMSRKFKARKANKTPREAPLSRRLRDAIRAVAKVHTKIERVREYHHKKIASILRNTTNRVAMEEHAVTFMIRNRRLARSASGPCHLSVQRSREVCARCIPILCCSHGSAKASAATARTCICDALVPKELSERTHVCSACGLVAPRDMVSANIVQLMAVGTMSDEMTALATAGRGRLEGTQAFPAGRQPVVMRGEGEGGSGESPAVEQARLLASEPSMKRKSPAFLSLDALPRQRKRPERHVAAHGEARRAGMQVRSAARAEQASKGP